MKKKITYSQIGDNYDTKDPVLRLSLKSAEETKINLKKNGFPEISSTRGGSAFVWDQGNYYMASVTECLGTKNLIADEMEKINGKNYYEGIAYDTVATFINDLTTVGAKPLVVHAYWAIEDNSWFENINRTKNFIIGWKNACLLAGATWGGGETPTLKDIIHKNTADLAGSVVGIIKPKKRLISEDKIKIGDRIILLQSDGPNANGISLIRKVAEKLKKGYGTELDSGKIFGEEALKPSHIYAPLVQSLLDNNINIHYIVNITGHGLQKLMRARQNYSYILEKIFPPLEIFNFIQNHANLTTYEMYQTYNMGMDYAIFINEQDVSTVLDLIIKNGFIGLDAGYVSEGPRKLIIKPKKITYESNTYKIR